VIRGRAGKIAKIMMKAESPMQAVVQMFINSGPWAVMALAMVLGIGYEAHRLAGSVGVSVSDYVIQSSANNKLLVEAMKRVEVEHAALLDASKSTQNSLKQLQDSTDRVADVVLVNEQKLREIQNLIDEARRIMAIVPEQRKEELRLLQEIEQAIKELCSQIKQSDTGGNS